MTGPDATPLTPKRPRAAKEPKAPKPPKEPKAPKPPKEPKAPKPPKEPKAPKATKADEAKAPEAPAKEEVPQAPPQPVLLPRVGDVLVSTATPPELPWLVLSVRDGSECLVTIWDENRPKDLPLRKTLGRTIDPRAAFRHFTFEQVQKANSSVQMYSESAWLPRPGDKVLRRRDKALGLVRGVFMRPEKGEIFMDTVLLESTDDEDRSTEFQHPMSQWLKIWKKIG